MMRIDELDEFQGVTPQVIAVWMTRNGWSRSKNNWWARGEDGLMFDQQTFDQQWFWLKGLADVYTDGNQLAMLRKINPRMRKGCPSDAARRKHDGFWLMRLPYSPPTVVKWNESQAGWQAQQVNCNDVVSFDDAAHCFFWPCDAEANKVRWPTDDNGNML